MNTQKKNRRPSEMLWTDRRVKPGGKGVSTLSGNPLTRANISGPRRRVRLSNNTGGEVTFMSCEIVGVIVGQLSNLVARRTCQWERRQGP